MSEHAVTEPLIRSAPFELTRAATEGDGLTLEGYAAVFDTPTRIDSWEGLFDEQIARGAFKKSLRETTPVLQFDHGRHPMVGSIPLGSMDALREDTQGLYVKARLHDNWLVQPVRDAIASGSVDGMSFRFIVVKDEWRDSKGNLLTDPAEIQRQMWAGDPKNVLQRTLKEVKVPELGPVVFPAYRETTVGVRSLIQRMPEEMANALRAELAQIQTSTPAEPGSEGRSGDEGAAPAVEPPQALPAVPNGAGLANLHRLSRRQRV